MGLLTSCFEWIDDPFGCVFDHDVYIEGSDRSCYGSDLIFILKEFLELFVFETRAEDVDDRKSYFDVFIKAGLKDKVVGLFLSEDLKSCLNISEDCCDGYGF